jgi:hypothetical protein
MDFSGPEPADFANVTALNRAFLMRLRDPLAGERLRLCMPSRSRSAIRRLSNLQVERLSALPYLLLSVRERDQACWRELADDDPNRDLLLPGDEGADEIVAATLSFLWQLARCNPYAVRLISGASLDWCEQLADYTLLTLLQRAAIRNDLLQPRLAENEDLWLRLLGPGLSPDVRVRRAAHLASLQVMLTQDPAVHYRTMKTAACSSAVRAHRIADTRRPG